MFPTIDEAPANYDVPLDFSKLKVGAKTLENATLDLSAYQKADPRLGSRETIVSAIGQYQLNTLVEASDFYYRMSGIYSRLCRYAAYLYRYDWFVTPYFDSNKMDEAKLKTIFKQFNSVLRFLDNSEIKKLLSDMALRVIRKGSYYGYRIKSAQKIKVQELPPKYCRSRFQIDGKPVVEFNMKYFKDTFRTDDYIQRMLKIFPEEFTKGYHLYVDGKLPPDKPGDQSGWYVLDPKYAFKFSLHDEDIPAFIAVIPAIIDLDMARELDKKKMAQKLLKIIVQKMPLDKNGELIFDVEEAKELHNNAVQMLGKAIGLDVLTTFAEVDVADLSDRSNLSSADELAKVERSVYNESGSAQNLFNTDGSTALEKSILNDEASLYGLLLQFERFLNDCLEDFNKKPDTLLFRVQLLTTTIYNYKDMSKLYKEQMQVGFSKMLPQIALGQSQSSILANAHFENDVLDLVNLFIPPMMSSTMNGDTLKAITGKGGDGAETGRPEKPEDEKSEKTLQNLESIG